MKTEGARGVTRLAMELVLESSAVDGSVVGAEVTYVLPGVPGASRRPTEFSTASSSCSVPGFDVPPPLNVFPFQISTISCDHLLRWST